MPIFLHGRLRAPDDVSNIGPNSRAIPVVFLILQTTIAFVVFRALLVLQIGL